MDFSWTSCFAGFWIFPLLCLLFMAFMMVGFRAFGFRCGHCASTRRPPEEAAPAPKLEQR